MNIFSNFVRNKYVTFNDRDPPWMNDFVKTKIKLKNQLYNAYIKNGYKDNAYNMLQEVINKVSKIISKRKEEQRRIQGWGERSRHFFCSHLFFFAITLKNYKLCYSRLN